MRYSAPVTTAAPPPTRAESATVRNAYLTDGARLFRVVAPLDPVLGVRDAVLEDCVTLKWRAYTALELWRLRLRPVEAPKGGARA